MVWEYCRFDILNCIGGVFTFQSQNVMLFWRPFDIYNVQKMLKQSLCTKLLNLP